MFFECIMAGFGGQGILSAGMILAHTAVSQNLNVTWFPSYGAEQRGGTANCYVVISDEPIGSPIISNPAYGYIMNVPSLDKFQPRFKSGAKVVVDTSLIKKEHINRDDIEVQGLDATLIATDMGNVKVANVIMIGALLKVSGIFSIDVAKKGLEIALPKRHHKLLPMNFEALETGYNKVSLVK
jgi:2-oxoglutarate ferredoxin oxidoreductase subunit gamma